MTTRAMRSDKSARRAGRNQRPTDAVASPRPTPRKRVKMKHPNEDSRTRSRLFFARCTVVGAILLSGCVGDAPTAPTEAVAAAGYVGLAVYLLLLDA